MLVSHKYKFIYFKPTKVAGTSVEIFFERFCLPPNGYKAKHKRKGSVSPFGIVGYRKKGAANHLWFNHKRPLEIKQGLDDDKIWNEYFKFGVIRNPWDRLVSLWATELLASGHNVSAHFQAKGFKHYCLNAEKNTLYKYYQLPHSNINYFIRFEELADGIDFVCKKLNLPSEDIKLGHYKRYTPSGKIKHKHYTQYYNDETRQIVAEKYAKDIEYFGYEFGE